MHQLFVVTSCRYTLTGLDLLMKETGLPVRVSRVTTPEQVLMTPREGGNQVVLVVMPKGSPAARAACRLFLWRWSLWRPSVQTQVIPCLLLCDNDEGHLTGVYPLFRQLSLSTLSAQLSVVLNHPTFYVRGCSWARPLTALQRLVLEATMCGEPVPATATRLGLPPRAVFTTRAALVQKLGLRNRMELMCLNGEEIL
ncbi:TPA: hypothetical protein N3A49_004738 [Salmonella enterica subsp. salamae serovar 56:l,v:z39]|nr:hypothetical protein [Salmonella enterica subsp. salamae serovar 56:l,v:z39]